MRSGIMRLLLQQTRCVDFNRLMQKDLGRLRCGQKATLYGQHCSAKATGCQVAVWWLRVAADSMKASWAKLRAWSRMSGGQLRICSSNCAEWPR